MRYGGVVEELASDVTGELPAEARREVLELVELVSANPRVWPDVRDLGSIEGIREAFGRRCWNQYMQLAEAIEACDIGWSG